MKSYLLPLIAAALLLVGCGENELKHGVVVGKDHRPESSGVYFVPLQTGQICSGNPSICTPIMTPFPFYYTDPEVWVLRMKDGEQKGSFYVNEEYFNRVKIGDYIDAGGQVSNKAPERVRGGRAG